MLNKVILQGRVAADIELKTTNTGKLVTSFPLAVRRDGAETTDFITIVAWQKTAEFVEKYFHKGEQMIVEGALQIRKWQDSNGNNRSTAEVNVRQVYFCGSKSSRSESEKPGFAEDIDAEFATTTIADDELPF